MQDTRKPMGINWIGLGTIVRREVSRMMRVPIQADGHFGQPVQVIPERSDDYSTIAEASLNTISFYPDHPTGLAIDSAGWIYLSVSEGRIYRFRPAVK